MSEGLSRRGYVHALRDAGVGYPARCAGLYLLAYAKAGGGLPDWVTRKRLTDDLGLPIGTASKALSQLRSAGLLEGASGSWFLTLPTLAMYESAVVEDGVPERETDPPGSPNPIPRDRLPDPPGSPTRSPGIGSTDSHLFTRVSLSTLTSQARPPASGMPQVADAPPGLPDGYVEAKQRMANAYEERTGSPMPSGYANPTSMRDCVTAMRVAANRGDVRPPTPHTDEAWALRLADAWVATLERTDDLRKHQQWETLRRWSQRDGAQALEAIGALDIAEAPPLKPKMRTLDLTGFLS